MARHPWWPNTKIPPGSGAWPQTALDETGRSGSITLNATSDELGVQRLCEANFATPTPCVVELSVQLTVGDLTVMRGWAFPAENAVNASGHGSGQLILEYGAGSALQRVRLDLRPGSYQLPPCEQVRAFVVVDTEATDFEPACVVSSVITPGITERAATPVYTVRTSVLAAGSTTVNIPDNAKLADIWPLSGEDAAYGTGAPILTVKGAAQFVRDYTLGVFAPPYMAPINIESWQDAQPQLTVTTTVDVAFCLQFLLEL